MKKDIVFVTGFFGAPVMQSAQRLAEERGFVLLSLDEEIQRSDGRSVRRICMSMGEHEYRNKEYETLKKITQGSLDETEAPKDSEAVPASSKGLVVCCGDGVLHDDMSKALILEHELVIVGGGESPDTLWEAASSMKDSTHAFMYFGSEQSRRAAFDKLYDRQRVLFAPYI